MSLIKHIAFSLLLLAAAQNQQVQVQREYQLKAAFLFNFCQFVNWPADAFTSGEAPLVIGVLGPNPFGSYLEETVSGEKISGRPVEIRYFKEPDEVGDCHLLFIGGNNAKESSEGIAATKGKNILTISDQPNFLKQDGMIRFMNQQNKIRFEINVEAARSAGLEISSKLLRLADIYTNPKTDRNVPKGHSN
ncbi:MAG: YfiR family protein [Chitinophagaceae bacterium]|nr:YfiR family protein [Chitinophagaceae bacterium]